MAKKILVIDDEVLITKSLQKLLKHHGYNVVIAQNALEAVEKAKTMDFDLIVSDVRMPEINGIEAIKRIREHLKEKGKPVIPEIVITGYADEDSYNQALDLKVAEYLHKPFDSDTFLELIQNNTK